MLSDCLWLVFWYGGLVILLVVCVVLVLGFACSVFDALFRGFCVGWVWLG